MSGTVKFTASGVCLVLIVVLVGCAAGGRPVHLTRRLPRANAYIGSSPALGSPRAPVKVIVFGDFECRYCRQSARSLESLRDDYPDEVQIIFKHYPMPTHKSAYPSALAAAAAARQGKFWEMHDLLFSSQSYLPPDAYLRFAKRLDLDLDRFSKDMQSAEARRAVARDIALAQSWRIMAVPTVVINGDVISGALASRDLEAVVAGHLPAAEK